MKIENLTNTALQSKVTYFSLQNLCNWNVDYSLHKDEITSLIRIPLQTIT